jgi:hypothetical protein
LGLADIAISPGFIAFFSIIADSACLDIQAIKTLR